MSRKLPPLPALSAFEAVARHRSFGSAAQELCVTRSAISHRIKTLEEHFGAQLFLRNKTAVTLTPEGRRLLEAVTDALTILQSSCEQLIGDRHRSVRISVGLAFASAWLMERLASLHRLHRDIDLEISALRLMRPNKLACLDAGEADVVLTYGATSDWKGYKFLKILKCQMFPVCSPSYYESVGGIVDPRALLGATLLRLPRQPWRPWFKAAGLTSQEPDRGPLFSHAGLMIEAAVAGQGVALVRDILVHEDLRSGRLMRVCDVAIDSAYYAIYHPRAAAKPELQVFLGWLETIAD